MQITIIAVGKEMVGPAKELVTEYTQRLRTDLTINWQLVPSSRSQLPEQCREDESSAIQRMLKTGDTVILLDERGTLQTNPEFADTFASLTAGQGRTVLIIGGAFGVNDELRSRAKFVWSLSKLVLPHKLVRVLLVEQLYRTIMVQKGHPYHHS